MPKSRALSIVQRYFPHVARVVDGTDPLRVDVTPRDIATSRQADHHHCAVAVACKRITRADGIIISITRAYIIKGAVAVRYNVTESISREITAFDRGAAFAPGVYQLAPIGAHDALGVPMRPRSARPEPGSGPPRVYRHLTEDIRAVLVGAHKRRGMKGD